MNNNAYRHLNYIGYCLKHRQAAVMVGAGFSRNAEKTDGSIPDSSKSLHAVVVSPDDNLIASVKLTEPNPYECAILRHPVGSRCIASITGKYAGGVFCRLSDGCTVVCSYTQQFTDSQFMVGDSASIQISGESRDKNWLCATMRGKIR